MTEAPHFTISFGKTIIDPPGGVIGQIDFGRYCSIGEAIRAKMTLKERQEAGDAAILMDLHGQFRRSQLQDVEVIQILGTAFRELVMYRRSLSSPEIVLDGIYPETDPLKAIEIAGQLTTKNNLPLVLFMLYQDRADTFISYGKYSKPPRYLE
jgi:hypothetical protein